jgi:hypothetical protein
MKIGSLSLHFRRIGIILAIVFVLALVMDFNSRLGELAQLQGQAATVRAQATGVMNTQEALQTQVAYATSPAAVDEYARGDAHMGKEGDKVVIILPVPGVTPPPTPISTPAINDLTPLDVWLAFILGQ